MLQVMQAKSQYSYFYSKYLPEDGGKEGWRHVRIYGEGVKGTAKNVPEFIYWSIYYGMHRTSYMSVCVHIASCSILKEITIAISRKRVPIMDGDW